jgi:hypothetical protein
MDSSKHKMVAFAVVAVLCVHVDLGQLRCSKGIVDVGIQNP